MSEPAAGLAGAAIMRDFVAGSPYCGLLGIVLTDIAVDTATLTMPFRDDLATVGVLVHGGALASLIDTAAMAAAWATDDVPANLRGTTVGLTVSYLAPAKSETVTAEATVLRRGRSLVHVDVSASDASGTPVAKGLVTYKLG